MEHFSSIFVNVSGTRKKFKLNSQYQKRKNFDKTTLKNELKFILKNLKIFYHTVYKYIIRPYVMYIKMGWSILVKF